MSFALQQRCLFSMSGKIRQQIWPPWLHTCSSCATRLSLYMTVKFNTWQFVLSSDRPHWHLFHTSWCGRTLSDTLTDILAGRELYCSRVLHFFGLDKYCHSECLNLADVGPCSQNTLCPQNAVHRACSFPFTFKILSMMLADIFIKLKKYLLWFEYETYPHRLMCSMLSPKPVVLFWEVVGTLKDGA
jgi:hypothetical protein